VNGSFYLEIMKQLLARIRRVRREFCENGEGFLLQDNAPTHTAAIVSRFLAKKQVAVLSHPPYSPDLAPTDYFLFPKIKMKLKGNCFEDVASIQKAVTSKLKAVSEESFSRAFELLYERSKRCVDVGGNYIE